jgi:hypothetical protein
MPGTDDAGAIWHKSSFSANGNCVEVGIRSESVLIRDTKDREGGTLAIPHPTWREFIQAIKTRNIL